MLGVNVSCGRPILSWFGRTVQVYLPPKLDDALLDDVLLVVKDVPGVKSTNQMGRWFGVKGCTSLIRGCTPRSSTHCDNNQRKKRSWNCAFVPADGADRLWTLLFWTLPPIVLLEDNQTNSCVVALNSARAGIIFFGRRCWPFGPLGEPQKHDFCRNAPWIVEILQTSHVTKTTNSMTGAEDSGLLPSRTFRCKFVKKSREGSFAKSRQCRRTGRSKDFSFHTSFLSSLGNESFCILWIVCIVPIILMLGSIYHNSTYSTLNGWFPVISGSFQGTTGPWLRLRSAFACVRQPHRWIWLFGCGVGYHQNMGWFIDSSGKKIMFFFGSCYIWWYLRQVKCAHSWFKPKSGLVIFLDLDVRYVGMLNPSRWQNVTPVKSTWVFGPRPRTEDRVRVSKSLTSDCQRDCPCPFRVSHLFSHGMDRVDPKKMMFTPISAKRFLWGDGADQNWANVGRLQSFP